MSLKLAPKAGGVIELQNGAGVPLLTFDASGNATFAGELADQDGRLGLGVGQTWQSQIGSRSLGVTYTNTTGKPILVSVWTTGTAAAVYLTMTVDGILHQRTGTSSSNADRLFVCSIVPAGSTYVVGTIGTQTLNEWAELR